MFLYLTTFRFIDGPPAFLSLLINGLETLFRKVILIKKGYVIVNWGIIDNPKFGGGLQVINF